MVLKFLVPLLLLSAADVWLACLATVNISQVQNELNARIAGPLRNSLATRYFRTYAIDLSRPCPFWQALGMKPPGDHPDEDCHSEGCKVESLGMMKGPQCFTPNNDEMSLAQIVVGGTESPLISESIDHQHKGKSCDSFEEDEFCTLDCRASPTTKMIDLLANPQKFTGFVGAASSNIWKAIYEQDCCLPHSSPQDSGALQLRWDQCPGKQRLFFPLISGLQTSIAVHIADQHWDDESCAWVRRPDVYKWRVADFPERLDNMILAYRLLHLSLWKTLPHLDLNLVMHTESEADKQSVKVI